MNELVVRFLSELLDTSGAQALESIAPKFRLPDEKASVFGAQLDKMKSEMGRYDALEYIGVRYLGTGSRFFELAYVTYNESGPLLWQFKFYKKSSGWDLVNMKFSPEDLFETVKLFE